MINTYEAGKTNPDIFKQLSVRDLLFVYYKCPQIDRLVHLYNDYNFIAFSLEGERILHQGGDSWQVTPQTSYFQRKSAFIQELPEAQNWQVLAFHVPDEFLIEFANEFMDSLPIDHLPESSSEMFIKIELNEVTRTFFHSLIPYFAQKIPPSEKLLELKFKELFLSILSNPLNKQLLAYILRLNDETKPPIWQVMEKNYAYDLSLNEYARISSRSLAAFKRDFLDYYQTTPGKWLTDKRLKHATMLLKTTKQNVSDIVFHSGFKNVSHFSRIFKQKFGQSPLQYRKNLTATE
ncbi:AraC family transcriptional regulator [Cytophaga sp. FL35]|uniref:helix-turn-helix domain-containing protein n=1 Tax=Cytophaga sp. FL35 TaxID=1904456 RepID=UPI0016536CF7|nr:AraC family transcriptional regulator [Cytophaga sp. FL35]MBC6998072.1 helix-turn-helix transcriptional regulator [Cytophaga sp. FL35]